MKILVYGEQKTVEKKVVPKEYYTCLGIKD